MIPFPWPALFWFVDDGPAVQAPRADSSGGSSISPGDPPGSEAPPPDGMRTVVPGGVGNQLAASPGRRGRRKELF